MDTLNAESESEQWAHESIVSDSKGVTISLLACTIKENPVRKWFLNRKTRIGFNIFLSNFSRAKEHYSFHIVSDIPLACTWVKVLRFPWFHSLSLWWEMKLITPDLYSGLNIFAGMKSVAYQLKKSDVMGKLWHWAVELLQCTRGNGVVMWVQGIGIIFY